MDPRAGDQLSCPLAVLTPSLGIVSETFIRRHRADLLPGRTAVVALDSQEAAVTPEVRDGPCLLLGALTSRFAGLPVGELTAARLRPVLDATRDFLRHHQVEVMLVEYLDFATHFAELAADLGIRLVAHAHGYDVARGSQSELWRERYRCLSDRAPIVTVSEATKWVLVDLGIEAGRITVIPCGVAVPPVPPTHRARHARACLAVGRMVGKKGPIFTLDAFRRALPSVPDAVLDYVGDGPLLPAAMQFAEALDVTERVVFHGRREHDQVLALMGTADLYLQHSVVDGLTGDAEGLPVAILEAMAAALPVVSTLHGGIPEAVEDGVTGLLVPEGDTAGMAECIVQLAEDDHLRTRMGTRGWERTRALFSWDRERQRLLEVLQLDDVPARAPVRRINQAG